MAIVVFGGAGFIGTHLLRRLRDNTSEALVSADLKPPEVPLGGVRYVDCDVRSPIRITTGEPVTRVYNLAAVHRTPGHPDAAYYDTNVSGALHVTQFCNAEGVNDLVFTSSISVYGPSEDLTTEETQLQPVSAYGKSKRLAEEIHREWRLESHDRRLVVVRPAVVFGPGEGGNFTRLWKSLRTRTFLYPGRRDTVKGCGYVDDLTGSIEFVRGLGRAEVTYNFAYPDRYTIEDICRAFTRVAGVAPPRATLPLRPMLIAGRALEALGSVGVSTGVNRQRVMKLVESTNIYPGVLVAEGYPYETNLETGIQRWLAEDGYLAGTSAPIETRFPDQPVRTSVQ